MPTGPCTGAQGRRLPTGPPPRPLTGARVPPQVLEAQGVVGRSRQAGPIRTAYDSSIRITMRGTGVTALAGMDRCRSRRALPSPRAPPRPALELEPISRCAVRGVCSTRASAPRRCAECTHPSACQHTRAFKLSEEQTEGTRQGHNRTTQAPVSVNTDFEKSWLLVLRNSVKVVRKQHGILIACCMLTSRTNPVV